MKTVAKTPGDCFARWGVAKCGGKGGKPGPCPIGDSYGTRTPAVKQRIQTIERGPLSYVTSKTHEDGLAEVEKIKQLHETTLADLHPVAAGKAELKPGSYEHDAWQ